MDIEPKKLLFCLLTAVRESDSLTEDLVKLHNLLEGSGELEGNFELLKNEIGKMLDDFEDFAGTDLGDDGVKEQLVQCFITYMWILRIHTTVDRYAPLLTVMDGIMEFNDAINNTNEFQESNI